MKAYWRRIGSLTVEAYLNVLLVWSKQFKELAVDEKSAQQIQQEKPRTRNSDSEEGKKKHQPA